MLIHAFLLVPAKRHAPRDWEKKAHKYLISFQVAFDLLILLGHGQIVLQPAALRALEALYFAWLESSTQADILYHSSHFTRLSIDRTLSVPKLPIVMIFNGCADGFWRVRQNVARSGELFTHGARDRDEWRAMALLPAWRPASSLT
jgi:hypothetical protein